MIKSNLIIIYNVNILTIDESLLQNIINMLPKNYQNKTKTLRRSSEFQVQLDREVSYVNGSQAIWI